MLRRLYYLLFALLSICALFVQYFDGNNYMHFFSYFTYESNIIVSVIFLYFALTNKKAYPWLSIILFGTAVVNLIITGVGYTVFLRNIHVTIFWSNAVIHYIMPVAGSVGWLIFKHQLKISYMTAFLWLLYPLGYLFYSFIRGPIINWYPYLFIDPRPHGFLSILPNVILLLALALISGLLLIFAANKHNQQ